MLAFLLMQRKGKIHGGCVREFEHLQCVETKTF